MFIGSLDHDLIFGGDGGDLALMSTGDDNDTVEGQTGFDTLLFNGNSANESIGAQPAPQLEADRPGGKSARVCLAATLVWRI